MIYTLKEDFLMNEISYRELIDEQKRFYRNGNTRSLEFRKSMLKKLKASILDYEEEIMEALMLDLGKSVHESVVTEIGFTLNEINHTLKNLSKWDKKRKIKTNLFNIPSRSYIVHEPYGATLIIGPWNYPFQLAMSPLVGAIAGGNCAVIKPSEISSHTAAVINKMISKHFDSEYIAVVEGGIPETNALLEERFDLIFFTGSTKVGRIIMEKAAKHLTPVILELGGKSPAIVDKDSDLKSAVRKIIFGKATNAGQTCVAPDYLLVHESIKNDFYKLFEETTKAFYGFDILNNVDYGKMINRSNYDRVKSYMADGKVIYGGEFEDDALKIGLTMVEIEDMESPIMTEEIFGPILPVVTFKNLDEVVDIVHRNPDPLALYVFSNNKSFVDEIVHRVHFGGGCVNDTIMHLANEHLPFGGRGTSGMGSYHGINSFKVFTHEKSILESSRVFEMKLKYPPYKKDTLKLIKRMMY